MNYGDDYISHLQIVHGITKNYNFFLHKALQNIKGAEKRKAECITLEEDEDMEEEATNDVLDPIMKKKLGDAVVATMEEMFQPIRDLLDGKIPLDSEGSLPDDINEDPFAADEKIWSSFQDLKKTINGLDFKPLIDNLVKGNAQKDFEEVVPPAKPAASKSKFKSPQKSVTKVGLAAEERRQGNKPRPGPRRGTNLSQNSPAQPPPPPSPARSDHSNSGTSSGNSSGTGRVTTYWCPLDGCKFSTTKEGMTSGAAAAHLKKSHAMTKEKMSKAPSGFYKFKKVKSEK